MQHFKYLGQSQNSPRANKTLYFLDTDSEELYDKHLSNLKTRNQLKRLGYTRYNITYKLNEHGFRADPFDNNPEPGFMTLGCSFGVGPGVDQANIWPRLLADKYNMQMFNLSESGSSGDTAVRLAYYWFSKLDIKAIFYLEPNINRREFVIHEGKYYFVEMASLARPCGWEDWLYMAADGETNKLNAIKNKLALKCLCRSKNIPFFTLHWQHTDKGARGDNSRDLQHPGEEWHIETMTKFDKMYQNDQQWNEY